jgi:transposase
MNKSASWHSIEAVGYIDETSWLKADKLHLLWVMVILSVALYLVHPRRSREAFNELIQQ